MPSASSAVSDSGRPVPSSLWRDSDFRRLWVGQTASQLGEQAGLVVLPLFAVLTLQAGAAELGVLRAVGQAPILLLSLFVGAWVDRWRTRTVMVLTDVGRTLALGAAAVVGLFGRLGLPALFVVAFAVGSLSVFFDVAYQACLVRLVRRDQLVRGNSALEGSRSAAQIGGPALGGAFCRCCRRRSPPSPARCSSRCRSCRSGESVGSNRPRSTGNVHRGSGGVSTKVYVLSSPTAHCGPCVWPRRPSSSRSRP